MFVEHISKTMEVYVDDMLVKSLHALDHSMHLLKMFRMLTTYHKKLNPNKYAFRVSLRKFLGFMVNHKGIEANLDKIQAILEMEAPQTLKEVQCFMGRVAFLNYFMSKAINKCLLFFHSFKNH